MFAVKLTWQRVCGDLQRYNPQQDTIVNGSIILYFTRKVNMCKLLNNFSLVVNCIKEKNNTIWVKLFYFVQVWTACSAARLSILILYSSTLTLRSALNSWPFLSTCYSNSVSYSYGPSGDEFLTQAWREFQQVTMQLAETAGLNTKSTPKYPTAGGSTGCSP